MRQLLVAIKCPWADTALLEQGEYLCALFMHSARARTPAELHGPEMLLYKGCFKDESFLSWHLLPLLLCVPSLQQHCVPSLSISV